MTKDLEVKVDRGVIKEIISAKISTAIATEIGNKDDIISRIVDTVLTETVAPDSGEKHRNESYNTTTFIDYLCKSTIQEAAQTAVKAWVNAQKESIEKHFQEQLREKQGLFAKVFMDGVLSCMESDFHMKVDVSLRDED